MTLYSKKEIVERARELAKMISETEEVDFFKKAEAQINENTKISTIINQIKALQKQAVNLKHYGKHEALKQVEEKSMPCKKNWMTSQSFKNSKNHKWKSIPCFSL